MDALTAGIVTLGAALVAAIAAIYGHWLTGRTQHSDGVVTRWDSLTARLVSERDRADAETEAAMARAAEAEAQLIAARVTAAEAQLTAARARIAQLEDEVRRLGGSP